MTTDRLDNLLSAFPDLALAVVGDFFLDKYLVVDRTVSETSLETGKEAFQVVAVRQSPGAAGTVVNNLAALGAGRLYAVGLTGDDGAGYELRRGLAAEGVVLHYLQRADGFLTPTYTKPMERLPEGREAEMNRLDVKNRRPLPADAEYALLESLRDVVTRAGALLIADQVPERNCGVITDRVRAELCRLGLERPELVLLADSRERVGEFRDVLLKPNREEARQALGEAAAGLDDAALGQALSARCGRPVFLTCGAEGLLVCTAESATLVPAPPVTGPVDIVGAGDSVAAALALSPLAGATPVEAAAVANVVASVTIQQLGTTGTATPEQVRARFAEAAELYAGF